MTKSGLSVVHIPKTKALRAVMLIAVALSVGAVFGQGHTLWQDGGVQLCGTSSDNPVAATSDSAGGVVVVWFGFPPVPGGIYAQRVDAAGVPQWTEDGVLICYPAGANWNHAVTGDGSGGALVAWFDGLLAVQRVSAEGVPLWGSQGLVLRPSNVELAHRPALVSDGKGGAIVVWNADPFDPGPLDTLLACCVDSSGNKQWETVVRIDTMDAPPCLCDDGLGGVIIAWQEYEADVRHVRVQRIDSVGVARWGAGVRACTLSTTQAARACLAVGQSCFVVGWFGGAGTWQHRAQMVDLAGNRLWGPAGIPVSGEFSASSGSIGLPAGSAGQTAWIWTENRTGTQDLFAQKLDSTGARCWDSTGVWLGTSDTSTSKGFSATSDGRGGAIAAWTLSRSRLNWDVYAQHVDSVGHLCWSDTGLAVCPGDNNVRSPVAVSDGDGGATIAWKDDRGIYAQRVADGAGVEETPNAEVQAANDGPTVVRGVLFLPGDRGPRTGDRAALHDVAGREVLDLKPGANDVRSVVPGIYFVRAESRGPSAASCHKVVVTR